MNSKEGNVTEESEAPSESPATQPKTTESTEKGFALPPFTSSTKESDFRLREYDRLTTELLAQMEEAWRLEKFAIGGSAGLVAWLVTHTVATPAAWCLPALFVVACLIRFGTVMVHVINRLGAYIKAIELAFVGGTEEDPRSWEMWFRRHGLNQTVAHILLWALLVVCSIGVGCWGLCLGRPATDEKYRVSQVSISRASATEVAKVLQTESKAGWSLVTTYSHGPDEIIIFEKK